MSLGTCLWCGHTLVYASPGSPPGDCEADRFGMYLPTHVVRDLSLIDDPLVYGKYCPLAPPHPLGQFTIHQLVPNDQQP